MQEKKAKLNRDKKCIINFYNQHFPETASTFESPNTPSSTESSSSSSSHSNSDSSLRNFGTSMTSADPTLTPLLSNNNKKRSSKNSRSATFIDKLVDRRVRLRIMFQII